MPANVYILIDPPGAGRVNLNSALLRARNGAPNPRDRGHARLSLDGSRAIVHGAYEQADLDWLLAKGWAVQYDHPGILAYLAANSTGWEPASE